MDNEDEVPNRTFSWCFPCGITRTASERGACRNRNRYENYLHAEFKSLLKFVDDVEFFSIAKEQVIHVRSASRLVVLI